MTRPHVTACRVAMHLTRAVNESPAPDLVSGSLDCHSSVVNVKLCTMASECEGEQVLQPCSL